MDGQDWSRRHSTGFQGFDPNKQTIDDPALKKALDYIETYRTPDGGYFKQMQPNYNTSCVLSLFAILPEPLHTQYKDRITKAQDFLKSLQQVEGKKDAAGKPITKDNPWYGGAGYGEDRPDLSNTAFFVEALRDSGVPANDPAIQKALVFVSHCQMNSETNSLEFAEAPLTAALSTPVWMAANLKWAMKTK